MSSICFYVVCDSMIVLSLCIICVDCIAVCVSCYVGISFRIACMFGNASWGTSTSFTAWMFLDVYI
jgi:hypothetical protein